MKHEKTAMKMHKLLNSRFKDEYDLFFDFKQDKVSFKRRDIIDINVPFQIDAPDSDDEI